MKHLSEFKKKKLAQQEGKEFRLAIFYMVIVTVVMFIGG